MNTQETQAPAAEFLASVELFSALTRAEIERLGHSAQSRLLAFGDTVCTAGEAAEGLALGIHHMPLARELARSGEIRRHKSAPT